jgi:hypothetical protein
MVMTYKLIEGQRSLWAVAVIAKGRVVEVIPFDTLTRALGFIDAMSDED